MPKPKNPTTACEWQVAVDAAHCCIAIHAAHAYGLITGGPSVNLARCEEILQLGAARGYSPLPDSLDQFLGEVNSA